MTLLDELAARALVGSQLNADVPPLPADLAAFVRADAPFEERLLDAAAACSLYAAFGAMPTKTDAAIEFAPTDAWPECSPRAAQVLLELLDMPHSSETILAEWLDAAERSKRRPPHHLLPLLLDRAAQRKDIREVVQRVADARGTWLATLNPKWHFAHAVPTVAEAAWQTGTRDERLVALAMIRGADPAKAVACLQDTWTADPADDRVRWLDALLINLAMADEPFLESCLDDRSSKVREAAADRLARLPESCFVARMVERLKPLLSYVPGQSGSTLKMKAKQPAKLAVTLPVAFDKAWQRDGISEKPPDKTGPKQWWMTQMLACVPPTVWSQRFHATAAELVEAVDTDYAVAVVTGWRLALARNPEAAWASALVRSVAGRERWESASLASVPEADRVGVVASFIVNNDYPPELVKLLTAWSPLSVAVSDAVIARFPPEHLLHAGAATRLHPSTLARLEPALREIADKPYIGRIANDALSAIALRRTIALEFIS